MAGTLTLVPGCVSVSADSAGIVAVVPGAEVVGQAASVVNGILQPPADLREIINKTAQFVARNGPEFESRILKNEQANLKFAFLNPKDPFHPFYRSRVSELGGKAPEEAPASAGVSKPTTAKIAPRAAPLEPPRPMYMVPRPVGVLPLDVDIIQLSAQYVARNGRSFLTGLANRESKNPQFDFLKPTHYLFPYFTSLVDAYSKCLAPPEHLRPKLAVDSTDPDTVLTRMLQHASFHREKEVEKMSRESADDAERRANLLIDWHDFVVVETIGFDDDEEALPAPQELATTPAPAKPVPAKPVPAPGDDPATGGEAVAAAEEEAAEAASPMVGVEVGAAEAPQPVGVPEHLIRRDYVPQIGRVAGGAGYAIDPITRQQVRLDEMEEHMRISLLDPKWKEQKLLEAERRKDSNVAAGDDISRNLKSFAARRTDIFGDTEVTHILARSLRDPCEILARFPHPLRPG